MRTLVRSLAVLSALALPVVSAHATGITYTATATLTDATHSGDLISATFGGQDITSGGAISFTNGPTSSISDSVKICLADGWRTNADNDVLDLKIAFTAPGTGSGTLGGDVDLDGFWDWQNNTIDWTSPTSDTFSLSNGSLVTIALTGLDHGSTDLSDTWCDNTTVCGTTNFTVSVQNPAATPEPSSLALLGTGILGLAGAVRRKFAL